MIREIAAFTAGSVRKYEIHNLYTTRTHPVQKPYRHKSRAAALALALTLPAAPAFAVGEDQLVEHLNYCLEAIATGDPTGPSVPNGLVANETGTIIDQSVIAHFSLRLDDRGDWVCELGDKSAATIGRVTEDWLRVVNTVDKYRSTFGENLYMAATVCVGPNAVGVILNGPLSDELSMGTAVFSGGEVNDGCPG